MSELVPAPGFRLRTWEYPRGTHRHGQVCNRCGYCADPLDVTAATNETLVEAGQRHTCPAPIYAWDHWRVEAAEQNVDPELADLGREVYRESHQHSWRTRFNPRTMIVDAKRSPDATRRRWQRLLDTDDGRTVLSGAWE